MSNCWICVLCKAAGENDRESPATPECQRQCAHNETKRNTLVPQVHHTFTSTEITSLNSDPSNKHIIHYYTASYCISVKTSSLEPFQAPDTKLVCWAAPMDFSLQYLWLYLWRKPQTEVAKVLELWLVCMPGFCGPGQGGWAEFQCEPLCSARHPICCLGRTIKRHMYIHQTSFTSTQNKRNTSHLLES